MRKTDTTQQPPVPRHALEAVAADFCKLDISIKWFSPDEEGWRSVQPFLLLIQDLYSGKIVARRWAETEDPQVLRLAMGDVLYRYGIPKNIYLNSNRAFTPGTAAGGEATQKLFKLKDEDPLETHRLLGIEEHWTSSLPSLASDVEAALREVAAGVSSEYERISLSAKDDDHGHPNNYHWLSDQARFFVRDHNRWPYRKTHVCGGYLSFDEAFRRSLRDALHDGQIRRSSEAHQRWFRPTAIDVPHDHEDRTLHLGEARYWAECLIPHRGEKLQVRFDPDAIGGHIDVYRQDGAYIGRAEACPEDGLADPEWVDWVNDTYERWRQRAEQDLDEALKKSSPDDPEN